MTANVGKLAGRTLFITGASRGIGKAIALKAARDGANVVIAAKTAEPHPKLPGTIYTAAKEVEQAGGRCLPCIVDIRHEEEVKKAVEQAVETFGGIDILVNNASAISLTSTLDTPMKRYDLMMGVNGRGTYLCSQACLPFLKEGRNPHILNISPPLNLNPKWFKNNVAYTMAKYGMSMCVLGMAEEFKDDHIAVNALWPRTGIYTAAMEMLGGGSEVAKTCRTPDIMADAAYIMLTKDSRKYTGNFCIDDTVLKEAGVTDLEQYSCVPGGDLLPDFFLDDVEPEAIRQAVEEIKGSSAAPSGEVGGIFQTINSMLSADLVSSINGIYAFELNGDEEGSWFLDLKNGQGSSGQGAPSENAQCTFTMDSKNFVKMFNGELKPTTAFMMGKMKIKGDMPLAMKLEKLMVQMRKQQAEAAKTSPAAEQAAAAPPSGQVADVFKQITALLSEDLVKSVNGVYAFEISGAEEGSWFLDLKNNTGAVGQGAPEDKPGCTFSMDTANFVKMFKGELKPTTAFMMGKMKIKGDMALAMKLEKLMGQMRKSKL